MRIPNYYRVEFLRKLYKNEGEKEVWLEDRLGNQMPANFVVVHGFMEGWHWDVVSADEPGKLSFVETNTWGNVAWAPVYAGKPETFRQPSFCIVEIDGNKAIFKNDWNALGVWEAELRMHRREMQERARANMGKLPEIPTMLVKKAWSPMLMAKEMPSVEQIPDPIKKAFDEKAKEKRPAPGTLASQLLSVKPIDGPVRLGYAIRKIYTEEK